MTRKFNNTGLDADKRDKSIYSDKRLSTQETNKAKAYRNATDALEERRLQRKQDREFEIGEDDE